MKKKKRISRVDVQVTIVTAVIMIASFVCVYFFNYKITHNDMIHSLKERSNAIYEFVDDYVDKSTFSENQELTMEDESYQIMKHRLEDVKAAANVRYLYTAKKTAEGKYIYLVDGLSSKSDDFRKPGDEIEPEIISEMEAALSDNVIMPDKIKKTTWGDIFVCYFPIHENQKVVGVLGIEFDAEHQYQAFQLIKLGTPFIAGIACIIAMLIALHLFKRISNPMFKDMANTDYLTNLKNRNAFEIDMANYEEQKCDIGILVADINDLKGINDRHGHACGDLLIQKAAEVMMKCCGNLPVYRYGGDEFVVICLDKDITAMRRLREEILREVNQVEINEMMRLSLSIGYAVYEETDENRMAAFQRADEHMYQEKRRSKQEQEKAEKSA